MLSSGSEASAVYKGNESGIGSRNGIHEEISGLY
jgi:hypothetical protein